MKNRTENAPGKTGVFDGHPLPPYDRLAEMAAATATATEPPPSPAKPSKGPTLARYAMVLLVAGPVALLYLLLGVVAQVLRVPSIIAFALAYGTGRVAKWLTAKIMGDVTIH